MQELKIYIVAGIMALASLLGVFMPQVAKADGQWPLEVLVSSAQARFEAQPTGYDASTNKYKYRFSWLMPARRVYSFKIDGKMYNANVTKNGVVETPFWFSPDIAYTIQIYPYANGRGNLLAEGKFTAPSVVAPDPVSTKEHEYEIVAQYIEAAPDLPTRTVSSKSDAESIQQLLISTADAKTFSDLTPVLSAKSIELLAQIPLIRDEIDSAADSASGSDLKSPRLKIYSGKQYASFMYKSKDSTTGKYENGKLIFIKENGVWKLDFIQMIKQQYLDQLKQ